VSIDVDESDRIDDSGEPDETGYDVFLSYNSVDRPVVRNVARRLREFLTMSADVNFDAKLVTSNGAKLFADPALQGKPDAWKMCFRAGREATAAARTAAQAWLKELGQ